MTATWSVDVDKRHRKVNFECEKSSYLYDTTLKDLKKNREIQAQAHASPTVCNTDFH